MIEALDFEGAPRSVLRDRDQKFGIKFNAKLEEAGIRQRLSAYRCPWQNGYVERAIGSIHRECLDHVIIFNQDHLRRVLAEYFRYYNRWRTHLGLQKDCPVPRAVESRDTGVIRSVEVLGGLHHRYYRRAA